MGGGSLTPRKRAGPKVRKPLQLVDFNDSNASTPAAKKDIGAEPAPSEAAAGSSLACRCDDDLAADDERSLPSSSAGPERANSAASTPTADSRTAERKRRFAKQSAETSERLRDENAKLAHALKRRALRNTQHHHQQEEKAEHNIEQKPLRQQNYELACKHKESLRKQEELLQSDVKLRQRVKELEDALSEQQAQRMREQEHKYDSTRDERLRVMEARLEARLDKLEQKLDARLKAKGEQHCQWEESELPNAHPKKPACITLHDHLCTERHSRAAGAGSYGMSCREAPREVRAVQKREQWLLRVNGASAAPLERGGLERHMVRRPSPSYGSFQEITDDSESFDHHREAMSTDSKKAAGAAERVIERRDRELVETQSKIASWHRKLAEGEQVQRLARATALAASSSRVLGQINQRVDAMAAALASSPWKTEGVRA